MEYPLCPCPMKNDLEQSESKIVFLQENWPSLACEELFCSFPKQELKCAYCLLAAANNSIPINQEQFIKEKKIISDLYQKISELYFAYLGQSSFENTKKIIPPK